MFTFIDLCAGIGGLRKPFEDLGGKCVFTCEVDKFAIETYNANFQTTYARVSDISKFDVTAIPKCNGVLAGFPCQSFSQSGLATKKRLGQKDGFEDETKGTIFFHVANIISALQPEFFLLENVKHLERHDGGRTFRIIKARLEREGYILHYQVKDAKGLLPQHRERIYIVGFKKPCVFSFPDLPSKGPVLRSILLSEVEEKYTLSDKMWQWLQDHAAKHKAAGHGFGFGLVGPEDVARTLSARYYKDGSEILIKQEGKNPRRLTPRECARLQGFSDDFKIVCSDTQAYKQFGNSVPVPVIKLIAENIIKAVYN